MTSPIPRCGDHVLHKPSGEMWVVAYADDFVLAPAGWPDTRAPTDSCEIVKRCKDKEHAEAVREWAQAGYDDSRRKMVLKMYASVAGDAA